MNVESKRELLEPTIKRYIRNISDRDLTDMPGYLDVILGSSVMITANYDVSKNVANGTTATVVDVRLMENAHVRWHTFDGSEGVGIHTVQAKKTLCLVLKLQGEFSTKVYFEGMPPGVVLIYPRTTTSHRIRFPNKEYVVDITSYKAVSCIAASTGHKTQGRTLTKGVVMGPPGGWASNHNGWVYVVLSRATKGDDIYLSEPVSKNLTLYKVRSGIQNEMERIREVLVNPTSTFLRDEPSRMRHASRLREWSFHQRNKNTQSLGQIERKKEIEQPSGMRPASRLREWSFHQRNNSITDIDTQSRERKKEIEQPTGMRPASRLREWSFHQRNNSITDTDSQCRMRPAPRQSRLREWSFQQKSNSSTDTDTQSRAD